MIGKWLKGLARNRIKTQLLQARDTDIVLRMTLLKKLIAYTDGNHRHSKEYTGHLTTSTGGFHGLMKLTDGILLHARAGTYMDIVNYTCNKERVLLYIYLQKQRRAVTVAGALSIIDQKLSALHLCYVEHITTSDTLNGYYDRFIIHVLNEMTTLVHIVGESHGEERRPQRKRKTKQSTGRD